MRAWLGRAASSLMPGEFAAGCAVLGNVTAAQRKVDGTADIGERAFGRPDKERGYPIHAEFVENGQGRVQPMVQMDGDRMSGHRGARDHRAFNELVLCAAARPESSPSLRAALRSFFERHINDDERRCDLLLAVGEATSNAIEHAYAGRPGEVRVAARVDGNRISVEVADRGTWRYGPSPDRGRGLDLMKALVDRMAIERSPKGTTIRLELFSAGGLA
ncbi:MAG: ATP-binding protein [Vulcanimicrobiaceae bacterium]